MLHLHGIYGTDIAAGGIEELSGGLQCLCGKSGAGKENCSGSIAGCASEEQDGAAGTRNGDSRQGGAVGFTADQQHLDLLEYRADARVARNRYGNGRCVSRPRHGDGTGKGFGAGNLDLAGTLYDSRRSSDRRSRDCAGADLPQSSGKTGGGGYGVG